MIASEKFPQSSQNCLENVEKLILFNEILPKLVCDFVKSIFYIEKKLLMKLFLEKKISTIVISLTL